MMCVTTNYSYDSASRLLNIEHRNPLNEILEKVSYTYDNLGRIVSETTPQGSIAYTYDAVGRRTSMQVAGQPAVDYTYDAMSRLTGINTTINGAGAQFNIAYDELGRRMSLTRPNGITTSYSYDDASNMLSLVHQNPAQIIEQLTYTYDANGNRISMDRQNVAPKSSNPVTSTLYNAANEMLAFNDKNITYDENGNMVSITNACGITTYAWDVRNRLVGITGYKSDCTVLSASFKYDGLGRRTEKTINGDTTKYLYDGMDIIQEIKNGMVYANYIRTLSIDEPLARIKADGTIRFYKQDALGSVIALTGVGGVIKTTYTYDPFGNTVISGEYSDNPFQFAGRENDGTGLYYYRARYYSPELQRFISEDSLMKVAKHCRASFSKLLMVPKLLNLYVYALNNPLTFIDATGQSPKKNKKKENEYGELCLSKMISRIYSGACLDWTDCFACCGDFLEGLPDEAIIICTATCEEGLELYKKMYPDKCKCK